jgi:putative ABC transport system ATP-binding protein
MSALARPIVNDTPGKTMIKLSGITKSYRMGTNTVTALRGADLEIGTGQLVALVGPSGSGKSTLLNICGLLDGADGGTYELDGRDTSRLSQRELALFRRTHLGFVFQGFNLVPVLSAFENVEIPLLLSGVSSRERKTRVEESIRAVGLEPFADHRPDKLSGGQRQRVAIARALVTRPRLVLADEPTANLDSATAAQVIDVMHEAARTRDTTFLVATHDDRMASRCDRVVSLRDGVLS